MRGNRGFANAPDLAVPGSQMHCSQIAEGILIAAVARFRGAQVDADTNSDCGDTARPQGKDI